jgi:chemotaxis protein methyltransferase CheR
MTLTATRAEFEFLRELVKRSAGIDLGPDTIYLVESRLGTVAERFGFSDAWTLLRTLKERYSTRQASEVVDAMTTNETFFFRDITPFNQLRDAMVPAIVAARPGRPIRVWSAACSTGQEPYSIAMTLEEMARTRAGLRADILATDISARCLDQARSGVYSDFEIKRGLSPDLLGRYFEKDGPNWRVGAKLRASISWRPHNLMADCSSIGTMDVIFCRNVLIYFDKATRRSVLDRMHKVLAPGGFLVLGGAETVIGVHEGFAAVPGQPSLYTPAT